MRNTVLITGADGFIGSHLVETMVRRGYSVRALCLYNSSNSLGWLDHCDGDVRGHFEVVAGDVRDPDSVLGALKGCSSVIHLASLVAIPYSYGAPNSYIETNVVGTLNVLRAARHNNVTKFVHTSTSEVYGSAQFVPISEMHPLRAQSPYAASKIAADQLVHSFCSSYDFPAVTIRPFNTYGPRQSARAVIPTIISQLAAGVSRISLGALTPTRDFSYVSDTVEGFIKSLEASNIVGETINLGSGFEISIGDLVNLISDIMGRKVEILSDEVRLRPPRSEVNRLLSDNNKAKTLIGWLPVYSEAEGLRYGLMKTIEWFTNSDNLSNYKTNIYNT